MKLPLLRYETRRRAQLQEELVRRARLWLPEWRPEGDTADVFGAILHIAARLESEVAERLDRMPEKNFRGLLHWLGVRGSAGSAARMAVAMKLAKGAEPALVRQPAQVQVDVGDGGRPLIFETQKTFTVVGGGLAALIGADSGKDEFASGPISLYEPPKPQPDVWTIVSEEHPDAKVLQLEPPVGLEPGVVLEDTLGLRYTVLAIKEGLVTLNAALGTDRTGAKRPGDPWADGRLFRARDFDPFGEARSEQTHTIYFGSTGGLGVTFPALLGLSGVLDLSEAQWSFFGTIEPDPDPAWRPLAKPTIAGERLILRADVGKLEPIAVNGQTSRWLKAEIAGKSSGQHTIRKPQLYVNCLGPGEAAPNPVTASPHPLAESPDPRLEVEGVANTAPLVLARPFHPLGREPRIFDAFYLGCDEVLSKPNALVKLGITIGDGFSGPLISMELGRAHLAVGVADDGKLHRIFSAFNTPKAAQRLAPTYPQDNERRPILLTTGQRPGAAVIAGAPLVTAAAGSEVWLWRTDTDGWVSLGSPLEGQPVGDTFVARTNSGFDREVGAISNGRLFRRTGDDWVEQVVRHEGQALQIARTSPVYRPPSQEGGPWAEDGLVLVSAAGDLFFLKGTQPQKLADRVDRDAYPLAVHAPRSPGQAPTTLVFAKALAGEGDDEAPAVIALDVEKPNERPRVLEDTDLLGRGFGFSADEDLAPVATFVVRRGEGAAVAVWDPFTRPEARLDDAIAGLIGPPVRLGDLEVLPLQDSAFGFRGNSADATVSFEGEVGGAAILMSAATPIPSDNLFLALGQDTHDVSFATRIDDDRVALFGAGLPMMEATTPAEIFRRRSAFRQSAMLARDRLRLDPGDTLALDNLVVIRRAAGALWRAKVAEIVAASGQDPAYARIDPELPQAGFTADEAVSFAVVLSFAPQDTQAQLSAAVRPAQPNLRLARLLQVNTTVRLVGAAQTLVRQSVGNAALLVLQSSGNPPAPGQRLLTAAADFAPPTVDTPDKARNPALSWEYWDGSSWRPIPSLTDTTAHFVTKGEVSFCAPADLQPTDVVGRVKRWIRARLVGGDYGQEEVTLVPDPNNPAIQKVNRDASKIRAPYITRLEVSYEVCCPIQLDLVLTQDNGGYRDQTAAARTANAEVRVFTPLGQALATDGAPSETSSSREEGCGCGGEATAPVPAPRAATPGAARAIYLGFDTAVQGVGVSLLFNLEDLADDGGFPLVVQGFIGGAFQRLVSDDGTRGLSETGILSVSIPEPLQQALFFGRALHWLRLTPRAGYDASTWRPRIRGVYLNAAWMTAAETQTNERLGSSDGSPSLRMAVSRTPVVAESLVLRVREPLGDEEVEALRREDPTMVLDVVGPWPGPWVRWTRDEPAIAGPQARVYAFDAGSGEIVFGDGRHGRIPPIGRDNVVAETYRAGGGARANLVRPWAQLNLITPIQGVEATVTPEGAAGGADAQDAPEVLRRGPGRLAMRERALTLRDFERLALESSARIGQARAFGGGRAVTVVPAMRGRDPLPSNAEARELERFLIERASPDTAASLQVQAPGLAQVAVEITATVPDLGRAAEVVEAAVQRLNELIDPSTGGHDGQGWPLGVMVTDADLAARLNGIPNLDDFELRIIPGEGATLPLRRNQLVRFATGAIRVTCRLAEPEGVA